MKFTEALRLGSLLCPQEFTGLAVGIEGRCALKTACKAVGADEMNTGTARRVWPWMQTLVAQPCGCNRVSDTIDWTIVHLNDAHHWTRKRIAEWVADLEPADSDQEQTCEGEGTRTSLTKSCAL